MTDAATSAVPLIPRTVLFGNPERTQPRISPGGQRLAYIAPLDGVLNVWVGPVGYDAGDGAFEPVTRDTDRGIRLYFWAEDGRHLVYLQDKGGNEDWQLYAVDPATKETRDLTPFENVQARPLEKNKHFPDELLVELNRRDPQLHDVHRLNLATGELELVAENPGNVAGWVADVDMQVRGALSAYPDGGFGLLVRKTAEDDWHELLRWGPEDGLNSGPVGFSEDGARMFLKDSREANASRLVRLDLLTEEVDILAEDPDYDASDVLVHPDTREVQAAAFTRARTEWMVLDKAIREDFAAIAKLHPGDFAVVSRDPADENWLVAFSADDGPGSYYAYDRDEKLGTHLFDDRPELKEYTLAPMEPVSFEARDGLKIHGYLTVPPALGRQKLPMILNVHGGPWARDLWGSNPEAEKEFLESRSPLLRVDQIKIPMLIAQGANDPRVKQAEAEQIVAAMEEKGIEHEYLLFPDEGHGFAKPENRLKFYAAAERFLAKHLGGRSQDNN